MYASRALGPACTFAAAGFVADVHSRTYPAFPCTPQPKPNELIQCVAGDAYSGAPSPGPRAGAYSSSPRLCSSPLHVSTEWPSAIQHRELLQDRVAVGRVHATHSHESRTFYVQVREASVIIAVSSPHRREAIEACHFCIDALKVHPPEWARRVT